MQNTSLTKLRGYFILTANIKTMSCFFNVVINHLIWKKYNEFEVPNLYQMASQYNKCMFL